MTRTIVPGDWDSRTEALTPQVFLQCRAICKAQGQWHRNGYKRKNEKKKGKESKLPKAPTVYCTPDVNRLKLIPVADLDKETEEKSAAPGATTPVEATPVQPAPSAQHTTTLTAQEPLPSRGSEDALSPLDVDSLEHDHALIPEDSELYASMLVDDHAGALDMTPTMPKKGDKTLPGGGPGPRMESPSDDQEESGW